MAARAPGDPPALRPLRRAAAAGASGAARCARGAAGPALRVERVDDLADARSDWTALAERSGNVFATWEWADVWWRHFGDGLRQSVALVRGDGGRVLAVVPLCLRGRRPLRLARFIGYGAADELGPVCPADELPLAVAALSGSAAELGWDVLLAERLPQGHGLAGRVLRAESSPLVATPEGGWEEYLAAAATCARSCVARARARSRAAVPARRRPRAAAGGHGDALRPPPPALGRGGLGRALRRPGGLPPRVRAAGPRAGLAAPWLAEVEGRVVAAWYGFRFGGAESYYQSGRDPDWDRSSVGLVLLAHTMRSAMEDGMREYRLLRGGEAYKDRFATADPSVETVAAGRGPVGRAAAVTGAVAARLPRVLRQRLFE